VPCFASVLEKEPQALITVIIPAFNEETLIVKCLQSLAAQTPAPDEVLVVDNNSTDGTAARVQEFIASHAELNVRLIHEAQQGCIPAREAGWRVAQGDVIVHVDADETFPPGWMRQIRDILAKLPDLAVFGGTVRFENAPWTIFLLQVLYNWFYPYAVQIGRGAPYLCGGMTVCKREVLEKLDGYRNRPPDQLEDYYLSIQAPKAGYKTRYFRKLYAIHSLRRYEAGGLKGFLQWGVAGLDAAQYDPELR